MQSLVKPLIAAWAFVHAAFPLCIMRTTVPVDIPTFTDAELAAMPSGILRANRSFVFNSDNSRYEKWDGAAWVAAFTGGGSVDDATTTTAGIIRAVADTAEMATSYDIIAVTPSVLRDYNYGTSKVMGATLTGDGSTTVWNLDFSASIDPFASLLTGSIVQVTDLTTGEVLDKTEVVVTKTSATTLDVEFATAPANLAQNSVVVICVRFS